MARMTFSRRAVLRTLAASAVTLPFARQLRADPSAPGPQRLVIFMQNNGTHQSSFWPADNNLRSPILDALLVTSQGADNGLRSKTTLIKGMQVPYDANGTQANQHDMGFARMWTGEKLLDVGTYPWGNGPSVDQIVAGAWGGIDTLTLAVLASEAEPHPKPHFDHRQSFVYTAPGILKRPTTDPLTAFNSLFGGNARVAHRTSVLDAVAGNLAEVSARLGPSERHKLDVHLTSIRDIETRLRSTASCTAPTPPTNYLAMDPGSEVTEDTYIPAMVSDQIRVGAAALTCGLRRIVTMQFGYGGGKWRFGWRNIFTDMSDPTGHKNCHDDVAHHDDGPEDMVAPDIVDDLLLMNQYYASCVAQMALALNAVPEGDGTMLDNTLIVWANEFGRGNHDLTNVPIVFIGGKNAGRIGDKAGLAQGGRVVDMGPQPFNRLGCTVLNLMGVQSAGFGDIPDCGVFQGL